MYITITHVNSVQLDFNAILDQMDSVIFLLSAKWKSTARTGSRQSHPSRSRKKQFIMFGSTLEITHTTLTNLSVQMVCSLGRPLECNSSGFKKEAVCKDFFFLLNELLSKQIPSEFIVSAPRVFNSSIVYYSQFVECGNMQVKQREDMATMDSKSCWIRVIALLMFHSSGLAEVNCVNCCVQLKLFI